MRKTHLAATAALALSLAACGNGPDFADAGSSAAASAAFCSLLPQGDSTVVSCDGVVKGTLGEVSDTTSNCLAASDGTSAAMRLYCDGVFVGEYSDEARAGEGCLVYHLETGSEISCLGVRYSVDQFFVDDRGGASKAYRYVTIGSQTWMAENLAYEMGAWFCQAPYGCYYTWREAMEACPSGWHLPSEAEWDELTNFAGGERQVGKKLKAESGWRDGGNGINEYGFSALPGGVYDGVVNFAGGFGHWWSSSESSYGSAYSGMLYFSIESIDLASFDKSLGFSVRCVKD